MKRVVFQFILVALCAAGGVFAEGTKKIRVACIGDSITYGAGIEDRDENSYPAQLEKLLGQGWDVENFGVSGHTLMNSGNAPYMKSHRYRAALAFKPSVVVINLGTNDSKPDNWQHKDDFIDDYLELLNSFRELEHEPAIWICQAVPVFPEQWGISDAVVRGEINPLIADVADKANVSLIDLHTPLKDHPEHFPDKLHPNKAGAAVMARVIAAKLLQYDAHSLKVPSDQK